MAFFDVFQIMFFFKNKFTFPNQDLGLHLGRKSEKHKNFQKFIYWRRNTEYRIYFRPFIWQTPVTQKDKIKVSLANTSFLLFFKSEFLFLFLFLFWIFYMINISSIKGSSKLQHNHWGAKRLNTFALPLFRRERSKKEGKSCNARWLGQQNHLVLLTKTSLLINWYCESP